MSDYPLLRYVKFVQTLTIDCRRLGRLQCAQQQWTRTSYLRRTTERHQCAVASAAAGWRSIVHNSRLSHKASCPHAALFTKNGPFGALDLISFSTLLLVAAYSSRFFGAWLRMFKRFGACSYCQYRESGLGFIYFQYSQNAFASKQLIMIYNAHFYCPLHPQGGTMQPWKGPQKWVINGVVMDVINGYGFE